MGLWAPGFDLRDHGYELRIGDARIAGHETSSTIVGSRDDELIRRISQPVQAYRRGYDRERERHDLEPGQARRLLEPRIPWDRESEAAAIR